MPASARSQTCTRKQDSNQPLYNPHIVMTQTLSNPIQGMPLQQQIFDSNIMETLQTPFDSTRGLDPNMTYTSQGVTSFNLR